MRRKTNSDPVSVGTLALHLKTVRVTVTVSFVDIQMEKEI